MVHDANSALEPRLRDANEETEVIASPEVTHAAESEATISPAVGASSQQVPEAPEEAEPEALRSRQAVAAAGDRLQAIPVEDLLRTFIAERTQELDAQSAPMPRFMALAGGMTPWKWSGVLAVACMILLIAKPHLGRRGLEGGFDVSGSDRNGRVELRWDPQIDIVKSAQGGLLDVVDGKQQFRYPVTGKVLSSGVLDYLRISPDASVTLTLYRDGQATAQAMVLSVGAIDHPVQTNEGQRSRRLR